VGAALDLFPVPPSYQRESGLVGLSWGGPGDDPDRFFVGKNPMSAAIGRAMVTKSAPMISFIRLPLRTSESPPAGQREVRPAIVAAILGLILCFQIGLVLWVYLKQL